MPIRELIERLEKVFTLEDKEIRAYIFKLIEEITPDELTMQDCLPEQVTELDKYAKGE